MDYLLGKDGNRTLRALKDLLRAGQHPLQILATLSSYGVKLYTIRNLLKAGEGLEKALNASGVRHRYAQIKYKSYLDNLSEEDIMRLIELLYRTDLGVKVRFEEPERALENFVKEFALR